ILENIFKKKEAGLLDGSAIRQGAEEVWLPLLTSLATTLIVFLPILFFDKKIQMQYMGFAFTVVMALVSSFFVAQMLVPMLMVQWAKGKINVVGSEERFHRIQEKIDQLWKIVSVWDSRRRWMFAGVLSVLLGVMIWQGLFIRNAIWNNLLSLTIFLAILAMFSIFLLPDIYRRIIRWSLRFRWTIGIAVIALAVFAGWQIAKRDIDWPSTLEENEFAVIIFPLAGAKLEANDEVVNRVETILSKIPDVKMFSSTIRKDDIRIFVRLKPRRKCQYSKDEIMRIVDEKGNESIKQIHDDYSLIVDEGASAGEQRKLIVNIFGNENSVLEKLAVEFAGHMSKVPGLSNLVMTDLRKRPEYSLVVDKGRAAVYGLTVKQVADSMHAQVRGMRPTKFHELTKGEEIETITRLQATYRQKIDDLNLVRIATDMDIQIPLGDIANFYPTTGPQTIDRKDKYRYVFVKGDTKRPLETIAREVKEALRVVKLPDEYYWRFGGAYEELMKGKSNLTMALILTLFLVYMVMACLFQSYLQPLLIMGSVPLAAIGIWLALEITNKPLSQNVFIGMILLAGYVVNAAIIMVDHMNHLKAQGMGKEEALIRAGQDRLRPILMTTLSTLMGFLPLATGWGQSSDLWSPLAITVIGGLVSSTLLTLFILPNYLMISEEMIQKLKEVYEILNHLANQLKHRIQSRFTTGT
ncbi:MAG: efflux RND transporter permease subunit, partial [Candidatus Omnitrophica bacterium]|nr:efflux RND transporter permease subunit [Candidatus Omnitrophota bacterium]